MPYKNERLLQGHAGHWRSRYTPHHAALEDTDHQLKPQQEPSLISNPIHYAAGERRLWIYIILDAYKLAQSGDTKELAWLLSTDQHPRSFVWVCGILDLDADYVRNSLIHNWMRLSLKRRSLSKYWINGKHHDHKYRLKVR